MRGQYYTNILCFFCILVVIVVNILVACSDGCEPGELRCEGTKVIICNGSDNWETMIDCANYEPGDLVCVDYDTDVDCEETYENGERTY